MKDIRDVPYTRTQLPAKRSGCGYRNPKGVAFRIIGDEDNEAAFGEFPWMVAVLREETLQESNKKVSVYLCGGALIHPKAVLTGAHCANQKSYLYKIRAGDWDTQTTKEIYPHQDRDVSEIVIHPDFYAGALFNDVAILILKEPVEIAENVNVVCLPEQNSVIENARCFASGWGKDAANKEGAYQNILKKVHLPIVPRDTCQEQLRKTRLGENFELHESFICAGGEPGKDTCKGDGGSPLACPIPGHPDRFYQSGIVAWGIGCGEKDTPSTYVNVALFRKWIDQQLTSRNLDTTYYAY